MVATPRIQLALLSSFELSCDRKPVRLPQSAQRLLAFLAMHDRPLARPYVAGALWPDMSDARAFACLRSALWRLHRPGYHLVEASGHQLRLGSGVDVDLHVATALTHEILAAAAPRENPPLDATILTQDLLPDWYDDWVVVEREYHRQRRLHALEQLSEGLTSAGRFGEAAEVALAAVSGDPLRESANRALIKLHLAEGNAGEAVRQYGRYRRMLRKELGLSPSPQMDELVRRLGSTRVRAAV